jgi:hypothetical protein
MRSFLKIETRLSPAFSILRNGCSRRSKLEQAKRFEHALAVGPRPFSGLESAFGLGVIR